MRTPLLLTTVLGALLTVGCGGDSEGDGGSSADGASSSGGVINPPPPGQATVSVDGQQFSFTEPGGVGCNVDDDGFSFSFRIGDNETTLGAGGIRTGDSWGGEIRMTIANPDGAPGPIDYFVSLPDVGDSTLAFNGKSTASRSAGIFFSGHSIDFANAYFCSMLLAPSATGHFLASSAWRAA